MAVFRVEKNKGYTVMSNHHLRNKELSLKAKGLLSQMLSLPEDWDYTLAGLSLINRESIDAIRTAVWELEKAGYITRRQGRDEKGKMTAIEYTIYEQPQPPALDCPVLENPTADKPILENPTPDNPTSENPTQLNKELLKTNLPKKEKLNTDVSSTHSIPFHSLNPSPLEDAAQPPERKRKEATDAYSVYEEIIKDNISYDILKQDMPYDHDRIDEKKGGGDPRIHIVKTHEQRERRYGEHHSQQSQHGELPARNAQRSFLHQQQGCQQYGGKRIAVKQHGIGVYSRPVE